MVILICRFCLPDMLANKYVFVLTAVPFFLLTYLSQFIGVAFLLPVSIVKHMELIDALTKITVRQLKYANSWSVCTEMFSVMNSCIMCKYIPGCATSHQCPDCRRPFYTPDRRQSKTLLITMATKRGSKIS